MLPLKKSGRSKGSRMSDTSLSLSSATICLVLEGTSGVVEAFGNDQLLHESKTCDVKRTVC